MSLFRINTNVSALTAQRNLRRGNNLLAEAQERLSSGLRINSAADDAAGLAISQKNTTQIRGLNQAATNAQDGISMIQTAEGGLAETQDSLQRMRELAVQASNDTLTESDREEIQKEVDALAKEVQRISDQTQFNTKNLLDGSLESDGDLGTQQLQVGANEGQTIEFNISDMGTANEALAVAGDGTLEGEDVDNPIVGVKSTDSNASTNDVPVKVAERDSGKQVLELTSDVDLDGDSNVTSKGTVIAKQQSSEPRFFDTKAVGGLAGDGTIEANVALKTGSEFTISNNGLSSSDSSFFSAKVNNTMTDVTAQNVDLLNFNRRVESGDLTLRVSDPSKATSSSKLQLVEDGKVIADQTISTLENGLTNDSGEVLAEVNDSQLAFDNSSSLFTDSNNVEDEFAFTDGNGDTVTFGGPDVTSPSAAESAISTLDNAINQVSSERAELGALQNRLETTISVNNVTSENLEAARSRIRDADIAKETVKQTRAQILIEAGTSVLAQANQNPQAALQLLGG